MNQQSNNAATRRLSLSILDAAFKYVPSHATSVAETWRRFGWHPAAVAERKQQRTQLQYPDFQPTWRSESVTQAMRDMLRRVTQRTGNEH
jgi:hypothetical protein